MALTVHAANRKDQSTAKAGVTLQHRHFAFIAQVIADMDRRPGDKALIATSFARACQQSNPRFDTERFFQACGVPL